MKQGDATLPADDDGTGGVRLGGLERRMRERWQTISRLWDKNKALANDLNLLSQLDYMGKLEQVIRDDGTIARGETVLLRMAGPAQDGPIQVGEGKFMDFERNYPMPKTGERRLFVLGRSPNDSYGSGVRGLLAIDGDVVRWATYDLRPVPFGAGKTPGEFIAEVKEVADIAHGS